MATIYVYATTDDLATWTGSAPPANGEQLLRSASLLVRRNTVAAVYDVDEDGAPTDADVIDALSQATCAQAAAMAAAGIDPLAGVAGASAAVQATSIGSASVQYAVAADASARRQALLEQLTEEAAMILRDAGLLNGPIEMAWG